MCGDTVIPGITHMPSVTIPNGLALVFQPSQRHPSAIAPAESPPSTPSRASRDLSSRSTSVPRYVSSTTRLRPPVMKTTFAFLSGSTNASVLATRRSDVWRNATFFAPRDEKILRTATTFGGSFPGKRGGRPSNAVGMMTMWASGPPASAIKLSTNLSAVACCKPPPAMTTAPRSGHQRKDPWPASAPGASAKSPTRSLDTVLTVGERICASRRPGARGAPNAQAHLAGESNKSAGRSPAQSADRPSGAAFVR
jgi:hypothetical protein